MPPHATHHVKQKSREILTERLKKGLCTKNNKKTQTNLGRQIIKKQKVERFKRACAFVIVA